MAGTETYALPDDFYKGLRLKVDGRPYHLSDDEDADEVALGNRGGGAPFYYLAAGEDGNDVYGVRPVPTESGNSIDLKYVYLPETMDEDDDEPTWCPSTQHSAIAYYARAEALGELEDDYEGEGVNRAKFERAVATLAQLRIARAGRDVAYMRLSGIHF